MTYTFRAFERADLPMIETWLHSPEVVRWWGEPVEQLALVTEDLDEPNMRQWIVAAEGTPFAYVQAYPAHAWPQDHLKYLPEGTEAIDAFVGVPEMLGAGHGGRFLCAFAEMLIAEGAPLVAIDPDIDNFRARRAYARAGFVEDRAIDSPDGPALVMIYGGSR